MIGCSPLFRVGAQMAVDWLKLTWSHLEVESRLVVTRDQESRVFLEWRSDAEGLIVEF